MKTGDCNIKNPLVRDGTSQLQRYLKALKTDYVQVDEREVDDLLAFIYEYSEIVQFYDTDNNPDGNWKDFIENDVSTVIALIAQKDLTVIKDCFDKCFKIISNSNTLTVKAKTAFNNIFQFIFFITDEINSWYNRSVIGLQLNTELKQTITSGLRDNLKTVIGTYKSASANSYLKDDTSTNDCSGNIYSGDFLSSTLNQAWVIPGSSTNQSWSDYLSGISEDDSLYGNETTDIKKVKHAAERMVSIVEKFIGAQSRIINLAPDFLEETLTDYPSHQPPMALFLAFFQLMDIAKKELNEITKRHLDYYYKDVMQLENREEEADTVHVIFQLAKQVDSYLIEEGTQLKAGKDDTDVEVIYKVEEDTVINKAAIDKIKTVFVDKDDDYRIYSAPVANSKDGKGTEFDTDEPKWKPFGQTQLVSTGVYLDEDERTMEFAEIGFAIASPSLFLNEGKRTVTIVFNTADTPPSVTLNEDNFTAYLSSEKEWTECSFDSAGIDDSANTITFKVSLDTDAPPIIAFNDTKIDDVFDSDFPVLKILLNNDSTTSYDYESLKDVNITSVDVKVEVTGMKNLILQNDFGLLKTNKPFYPFSTIPGIDSSFYIGSSEVFQKDLSYLNIDIIWKDVPDSDLSDYYANYDGTSSIVSDNSEFLVQCQALINGSWDNNIGSEQRLFEDDATDERKIKLGSQTGSSTDFNNYSPGFIEDDISEYFADTQRGFIKLVLTGPPDAFGHKLYPAAYTKAVIDYANAGNGNAKLIPNPPYTPYINNLTLDYNSSESINLHSSDTYEDDDSVFFHINPFGIKKIRSATPAYVDFLPQFQFDNDTTTYESEGELYIGISDLTPPQSVCILFQMAEGSADPELPTQNVYWSYLSDDEWIQFEDTDLVSDGTEGLIKSGIIEFSIPGAANDDNTVLPDGVHWIRAALDQNSSAVCDCIAIVAQSAKAVYSDNGNDPDFLSVPIEDGTITGLKTKDANVKKVSQPYSSLGGKTAESDDQFYVRVSERLRHKERGITIWDYEHLVLQEFPSIYKVKCINHSTYISDVSEFAPGYVSVIVIPSLLNKNAVDPLEPRASIATLTGIQKFLKKKISAFAYENLEVLNPLYEKIKVDFKVKFFSDFNYYKKVLEEDIIEFLSPWVTGKETEITFGGVVYKSSILNFIEERDYVDYVTDLKMSHITEDEDGNEVEKLEDEITVTTARSILVSNDSHTINEALDCA